MSLLLDYFSAAGAYFSARFLGAGATYPQRFNFEVLPERGCPSSFFTLQREVDSPCNDLAYLF